MEIYNKSLGLKELKPFQRLEFISMILLGITIPMSWRLASYFMLLLFASGLLKGIFEKGFNPNPFQYKHKIAYIVFLSFWVLYAISIFYSNNISEAWIQILKKLPFFIFPLYFLISNLSYFTKRHFRIICYFFTISTLLVFIANFGYAAFDYFFRDASSNRFINEQITKIYHVHHTYMAMYTCLGISFNFSEMVKGMSKRLKIFNTVSIILLTIFTFLLASRAGILCLCLLFIIQYIRIFSSKHISKKEWVVIIIITMTVVLDFFIFSKSINRIVDTLDKMVSEDKEDIRVVLYKTNFDLIKDIWPFGVGCGDRCDCVVDHYHIYKEKLLNKIKPLCDSDLSTFAQKRDHCIDNVLSFANARNGKIDEDVLNFAESLSVKYNCDSKSLKHYFIYGSGLNGAINYSLNSHNQYFDTVIATGIIGLLLLLSYFIIPIVLFIKNKDNNRLFFSFLFIIAINALFESIFETQNGIVFFIFLYMLFFHVSFCQSNK